MQDGQILATVDLGSNSFRIEMARLDHGQLVRLDYYKEPVRLGAGLDTFGNLTPEAIERGVACLSRFAERLRGIHPDAMRAVATQSLRSARNPEDFLIPAQKALGYPIDIISGHEEARLIYQGVANVLPKDNKARLVVDIGGGSTELIVGVNNEAHHMDSMKIGCVSHTLKFFSNGRITAKAFDKAIIAAAALFEEVIKSFHSEHWQLAYGSSGTIEAVSELCMKLHGSAKITLVGMSEIAQAITSSDDFKKWPFSELKSQRAQVLPGGLAVLMGLFQAFDIQSMEPCYSALRQGVMADLLGRDSGDNVREQSIARLVKLWSVDQTQAGRVQKMALNLLKKIRGSTNQPDSQWLMWAARTHEVGMAISHDSFHRHGAYILNNVELAGFSRTEQAQLAQLVASQRGGLRKTIEQLQNTEFAQELLCLRMAILLCHARTDAIEPNCTLQFNGQHILWRSDEVWREKYPLSAYLLEEEWRSWEKIGITVDAA